MPRFFFHVHDELDVVDDEGIELLDEETALAWAKHEARELAADAVKRGVLRLNDRIVVVRAPDEEIGTVMFRDAIQVEG